MHATALYAKRVENQRISINLSINQIHYVCISSFIKPGRYYMYVLYFPLLSVSSLLERSSSTVRLMIVNVYLLNYTRKPVYSPMPNTRNPSLLFFALLVFFFLSLSEFICHSEITKKYHKGTFCCPYFFIRWQISLIQCINSAFIFLLDSDPLCICFEDIVNALIRLNNILIYSTL